MNLIKKIFAIIALTFSLNVSAQRQMTIHSNNYNNWIQSNPTCAGCGSFFVMVVNEKYQAKNGYYYSYIYLWSNSYFPNSYASSSYIKNIEVFFVDNLGRDIPIINFNYALVPPKSNDFDGWFQLAYLYSVSPNQTIKIKWSEVNAW